MKTIKKQKIDLGLVQKSIDLHFEDMAEVKMYELLCEKLRKFINYGLRAPQSKSSAWSRFIDDKNRNDLLEGLFKIQAALYEIKEKIYTSLTVFSGLDARIHKEARKRLSSYAEKDMESMQLLQHFGFIPNVYKIDEEKKLKKQLRSAMSKRRK